MRRWKCRRQRRWSGDRGGGRVERRKMEDENVGKEVKAEGRGGGRRER